MASELQPEAVLRDLEKGRPGPLYLLHGPCEFLLERVLEKLHAHFASDAAAGLNRQVVYGDEADPGAILDSARSLPFFSSAKLIVVRRTEAFSAAGLELFLPYLDRPLESTCLVFVAARADFRRKFYARLRELGASVFFREPAERQLLPWIQRLAGDLGLRIDGEAAAHLIQLKGDRLHDLYAELEKLALRHGAGPVGVEEVRELAIFSRSYSIFELTDEVGARNCGPALEALNRFLEAEGREGPLRVMGMLNRQVRLLWQAREMAAGGAQPAEIARSLRLPVPLGRKLLEQSRKWSVPRLEGMVESLWEADRLLKTGSPESLVLENVVVRACGQEGLI